MAEKIARHARVFVRSLRGARRHLRCGIVVRILCVRPEIVPEEPRISRKALCANAGSERSTRQPGAYLRSLPADAVGRLCEMVMGESGWRAHRTIGGVAKLQDRRRNCYALGQGPARSGAGKNQDERRQLNRSESGS